MTSWIGLIPSNVSLNIMIPPSGQKVKLVAIKMRKNASFRRENLKRQRQRDDNKKIETWEKMKKELKPKYLPFHYRKDIFLKIQNLKQ